MSVRIFDGDAPDSVFAFLDQAVSERGREHWHWKYRTGSARSPQAFYWQDDDGAVLGFIGLMRTTLQNAGGEHPAAWFVDWHVLPGAHGVGVGIGLLRKAEAEAGILLTLQGSADTRKILPRLGWKESSSPATWIRPLTSRLPFAWIEQRMGAWARGLARVLAAATSLHYRLGEPPTLEGTKLIDVERFPGEYDEVWRERSREFAPAMRRDSDYVNYLCADYPDGGYRLQLLEVEGKTVGHLVWRVDTDRSGLNRGRVVDVVWPLSRPDLGAWLVSSACWQLRCSGADYVECVASHPRLQATLGAQRFRRRRPVPIWYHRLSDGAPDPDTWHITFLDCDRAYR